MAVHVQNAKIDMSWIRIRMELLFVIAVRNGIICVRNVLLRSVLSVWKATTSGLIYVHQQFSEEPELFVLTMTYLT